jgi:hypothetical protein
MANESVTGPPAPDELPMLIDEGLRLVEERIAGSPAAQIYDSIKAQLTYVREVVHGTRPRDAAADDRLLLNRYAAREFETSDPPFADVLSKVHYLYDRWDEPDSPAAASPAPRRAPGLAVVIIALVAAAGLMAPGIFFLVQRATGTRAEATVGDCEVTGGGRYRTVHCTGSWIVGGSLLEGGHVIVGTIEGVDTESVGKTIDVTLRGDTAYSRGLTLPLLLIGFGLIPIAAVVLLARTLSRRRPKVDPD